MLPHTQTPTLPHSNTPIALLSTNNAHTLRCCLDVPPAYRPQAQYAVRMLLMPLGYDPVWVERGALAEGIGLYYGTSEGGKSEAVVVLPFAEQAARVFEARDPVDPAAITWEPWGGASWPVIFRDPRGAADLIASAFFWLSGWQEVTTAARDQHGRFPFAASLQSRLDTALRPAVDAYREMLAERLEAHGLVLHRRSWLGGAWALCPTHDIDYLRKWRLGMIYREVVPYLLRNQRNATQAERLGRFRAFARDALRRGDVYREAMFRMPGEVKNVGGTATYFFKTGAHGPRDVPYSTTSAFLRRFVERLVREAFEVGLHPSFHAHNHPAYLHEERQRLIELAGAAPRSVRQHYLRYEPGVTGRLHEAAGFEIDSSLGFAECEGFRHGTCLPFQLYDLDANAPLDVWEMPLAVMEAALFNRRNLSVAEALDATQAVMDVCRRFGGVAVMLWHNVLWDELDYPGWGQHFTETLDAAANQGARIASLAQALDGWR